MSLGALAQTIKNFDNDLPGKRWILLLLLYNIVVIIRGILDCNDLWDYRMVIFVKTPYLLLPAFCFWGCNKELLSKLFHFLLFAYALPVLCLAPRWSWQVLGVPYLYLYTFMPFMRVRWILILIVFAIISMLGDLGARSYNIRVIMVLLLSFCYFFDAKFPNATQKAMKIFWFVFWIFPIVSVLLATTNTFNVLEMDRYVSDVIYTNTLGEEGNLSIDTRSHLFLQVSERIKEEDALWFGLGGLGRYNIGGDFGYFDDGRGRDSCESGVLNNFMYGGLICVFGFSLLYWIASWLAVFRSNNILCRTVGLFLIFRWDISFLDDPVPWWIGNIMTFLIIGFCCSPVIRGESMIELKKWLKSI